MVKKESWKNSNWKILSCENTKMWQCKLLKLDGLKCKTVKTKKQQNNEKTQL